MKIHAHSLHTNIKTKLKKEQDRQTVKFVYDPDGRDSIKSARLIGSWDKVGAFSESWDQSAIAMKKMQDGTFLAEVPLDSSHSGPWQWGIMADGPAGEDRWAILDEETPSFHLESDTETVSYSPTTRNKNGALRQGDDVTFRYWAPDARQVEAAVWSPRTEETEKIPLTKTEGGYWEARADDAWPRFDGKLYAYDVTTKEGAQTRRADPYARQRMGPQRGVSSLHLHAESGQEVNKFDSKEVPYTRFEVQDYPGLVSAKLVFSDSEGEDLDAGALKERLGTQGGDLVKKYHGDAPSDFWLDRLDEVGAVTLLPQGEAFAAILPDVESLLGLNYRFEGFDKDGQLLGDLNLNGRLEPEEAVKLPFNDPFSSKIDGKQNWQRFGIIEESRFDWKHDQVPRLAQSPEEQIVYQIHPGSIFGSHKNVDRTSFKEIVERLDYFEDLGVNTLQIMPVDSTEGNRDWGYIGSHNFAVTENYGFVNEEGEWVQGDEALKQFVDAAHSKGFKVFSDVVYNHFGGDFNNVWNVGGEENPWFEWAEDPAKPGDSTKSTPWGALPAYNKEAIREYITNHALHQLDEFHFDGLRFDFTHPIHDQGSNGGGDHGWEMLQKINRTIDFFHPQAFIAAEEFPNHPVIVTPPAKGDKGGAGFDAMWNTEFQHRLVNDHGNPSVLQEAARGRHTRIDKLMNHLLHQPGFGGPSSSVTVISNHDEVGNADRTVNVANLHRDPSTAGPWERGAARTTLGIGLLSPGMPLMFQGEESLATNNFKWGIPSTWDNGWEWRDQPESPRFKHHQFSKDLIKLRQSSVAFDADAEARRVYTHELDSVMAFSRKKGDEEYLVVASFNKAPLANYPLATEGRWEPVLLSDNPDFGGEGQFQPRLLDGPQGSVDLAPGSLSVYRRVG